MERRYSSRTKHHFNITLNAALRRQKAIHSRNHPPFGVLSTQGTSTSQGGLGFFFFFWSGVRGHLWLNFQGKKNQLGWVLDTHRDIVPLPVLLRWLCPCEKLRSTQLQFQVPTLHLHVLQGPTWLSPGKPQAAAGCFSLLEAHITGVYVFGIS